MRKLWHYERVWGSERDARIQALGIDKNSTVGKELARQFEKLIERVGAYYSQGRGRKTGWHSQMRNRP